MRSAMVRLAYRVFRSPKLVHEVHVLSKRARDVLLTRAIVSIRPLATGTFRAVAVSV